MTRRNAEKVAPSVDEIKAAIGEAHGFASEAPQGRMKPIVSAWIEVSDETTHLQRVHSPTASP